MMVRLVSGGRSVPLFAYNTLKRSTDANREKDALFRGRIEERVKWVRGFFTLVLFRKSCDYYLPVFRIGERKKLGRSTNYARPITTTTTANCLKAVQQHDSVRNGNWLYVYIYIYIYIYIFFFFKMVGID